MMSMGLSVPLGSSSLTRGSNEQGSLSMLIATPHSESHTTSLRSLQGSTLLDFTTPPVMRV